MKKIISLIVSVLIIVSVLTLPHASYADSDNLAFGKPTSASSTLTGYVTSNINDGDYNTNWVRGNYGFSGEWIQIDLEDTYILTSVVFHARLDTNEATDTTAPRYRMNVDLWLSNDPEFKTYEKLSGFTSTDKGYGVPVTIKPPKKAYRYLRAVKTDTFIFVLAEIEAFGYPASAAGDETVEYTDAVNTKYETPVTLLDYLGAVKGMTETEFGVYNRVTRAQAAEMAVNTFMPDFEMDTLASNPFTDIDASHPYFDSVIKASSLGYIIGYGDSLFRPDNYVSCAEFATMVVRAMEYNQMLLNGGSYEANLAKITRDLKLYKNVSTQGEFGCGEAVIILYNALLANSMELSSVSESRWEYTKSDIPLLKSIYNMDLYDGVVNETGKFKLNGDTKRIDNSVTVGDVSLNDPSNKLLDYLGRNVTVGVYDDSKNAVAVVLKNDKNNEINIAAADITGATSNSISYMDAKGTTRTRTFSSTADVIYNGAPYPGYTADDLKPQNGSVTILDNDNDGEYEVVFVKEYEVYYVLGSYSDGDNLTFVDDQNAIHTLNLDYLSLKTSEGYPAMNSSVKNGAVVKLYKAKNSDEASIVIYSKANVTGAVEEYSADEIKVSGTNYKKSDGFPEDRAAAPRLSAVMDVYLDETGDIIYLKEDTSKNGGFAIGFSQFFEKGEGLDDTLQFKIFTEKGVFIRPFVADRITVDGISYKKDAFVNKLYNDAAFASDFKGKLLRYKQDSNNNITAFDTLNKTGSEYGITFSYEGHIGAGLYSTNSKSFWNVQKFITMAEASSPVFTVPYVNGEPATDSDFDNMFEVNTLLTVVGDKGNKDQNIDMFMKNEEGFPACFMSTVDYPEQTGGSIATTVMHSDAPFMIVKSVSETPEGFKVRGADLSSGEDAEFSVLEDVSLVESWKIFKDKFDNDEWFMGSERRIKAAALNSASDAEKAQYITDLHDIKFGDILRYEIAGNDARAVERVFNYVPAGRTPLQERDVWFSVEGSYPKYFLSFNRFQFARFTGYDNTVAVFDINGSEEKFIKSSFHYILRCDADTRTFERESPDGLYAFENDNDRIMIYTINTRPTGLIIYEY